MLTVSALFCSDATLDEIEYDLALLKCNEVLHIFVLYFFMRVAQTFSQACRKDIVALVSSTRDSFVTKIK
jgi:hypothetical protein